MKGTFTGGGGGLFGLQLGQYVTYSFEHNLGPFKTNKLGSKWPQFRLSPPPPQ